MTVANTRTVLERLYDAYPDSDLLPIDPSELPGSYSDWRRFVNSMVGDTLFQFLCRELADPFDRLDDAERVARCNRAINDLIAVRDAFA